MLRDLNNKNLPMLVLVTGAAVVLYVLHAGYLKQTGGRLPGEIETFHPSYGDRPSGFFEPPAGEVWGMERATPTSDNLYVMGPRDARGKVIPRVFCDRKGLVSGVVQPDGTIQWKGAGR
jgi:hypothetical protein